MFLTIFELIKYLLKLEAWMSPMRWFWYIRRRKFPVHQYIRGIRLRLPHSLLIRNTLPLLGIWLGFTCLKKVLLAIISSFNFSSRYSCHAQSGNLILPNLYQIVINCKNKFDDTQVSTIAILWLNKKLAYSQISVF